VSKQLAVKRARQEGQIFLPPAVHLSFLLPCMY
jgi:hypothetical protein